MKIVVAPDSFKGSISAIEAANCIERGILQAVPSAKVCKVPMADGGEGSLEALVEATGGSVYKTEVMGPLGEKIKSYFGILGDGETGVVEMAAASGLVLVEEGKRNPMVTTTYGTGELIKEAVDAGCRKLIICIGGSATNDGGMGMAQALGVKFLDNSGKELGFGGQELIKIHSIDLSNMKSSLKNIEFHVACDVKNPLYGPEGAAFIYGPQKGANKKTVEMLDKGLRNFSARIKQYLGVEIADIPGSGAAGGLGGGLVAFLNAKLESGIDMVTAATALEEKIKDSVLVFTGEGKTDSQTIYGKVPMGVGVIAQKHNVPVICLSGSLGNGVEALYNKGITALFSIIDKPMSLDEAMRDGSSLLTKGAENLMRLFNSTNGNLYKG